MAHARLQSSPLAPRNSPRVRRNDDSPSRQLQLELERALSQVHLHEVESSKLHAYHKRQQQEELDAHEAAQAHVHQLELNAANAQHEVVRRQAEAVLQAYVKKEEEVRVRRLEEEQRRLEEEERRRKAEEEAQRRAEGERNAREERQRREQEARAQEAAQQRAKEAADATEKKRKEAEAAEQQRQEEKTKADHEAALKLKQQEEEAAAKSAPAPQPSISQTSPNRARDPAPAIEKIHNEYLALHKKLKKFRSDFWTSTRDNKSPLKPYAGDMRRAMRTSVGQLTDDKAGNKKAVCNTMRNLMSGLSGD